MSPEKLAESIHEKIDIKALSQDDIQNSQFKDYFKKGGELEKLPDSLQQQEIDKLFEYRYVSISEASADKEPDPQPNFAFFPIEKNGDFSMLFDQGLAGPEVLAELGKEIRADGRVSLEYFADDLDKDEFESDYG